MQSEIEHLKQPDALSAAVEQFGKDFPSIVKPLVTERDQYMVGGWVAGWEDTRPLAGAHTLLLHMQLRMHELCCLPARARVCLPASMPRLPRPTHHNWLTPPRRCMCCASWRSMATGWWLWWGRAT